MIKTAEDLRQMRDRQAKEREQIATRYDEAADALLAVDPFKHHDVIHHLRLQAKR